MPNITIDGKEYQAQDGQTVIEVALENGIEIPHFCWHPALSVAGNCRMCLVELEKNPKLQIACATPATDGLVVNTISDVAVKGREDVMEFLLINHPLDCPICDEAGQCKLQDYEFNHSRGESRFVELKTEKPKRVPFGPNVLFDGERCISCSRCVRFATEVVNQPVLTFVDRGDHVTIQADPAESFDNIDSMNVIDICPVGALTSRDFRFKARVWDMSFTDTICPGCSTGCNIRVGVRNNEVLRLEPRTNMEVNDYWMCDYGRLETYPPVNEERIEGCHTLEGGSHVVIDRHDAIKLLAQKLAGFKHDEILFLGSAFSPVEDNYMLGKLAKAKFGRKEMQYLTHFEGEAQGLLLKAEKMPNARGLNLLGLKGIDAEGLTERIRSGKIKAIVALEDNHLMSLTDALGSLEFFGVMATNWSPAVKSAHLVFAVSTWAEREGIFVNDKGHAQLLRPALATMYQVRGRDQMKMSRLDRFGTVYDKWARANKRDVVESWRIIQDLFYADGTHKGEARDTEDVFDQVVSEVSAFANMSYEAIAELGMPTVGAESHAAQPVLYQEVYQQVTNKTESIGSVML